jgi:hypothetical protein
LLVISTLVVGSLLMSTEVRLDETVIEKVRPGMSEGQISALVGGPPGDYSTAAYTYYPSWGCTAEEAADLRDWLSGKELKGMTRRDWITDEGHLLVGFNDDRRAQWISCARLYSTAKPTLRRKILAWLRQHIWEHVRS